MGVALLTDHTTSYTHGPDHPLGLTLQYSGVGLWGRNYSIQGPTTVHYALLPHAGNWQTASLWTAGAAWSEPLLGLFSSNADKTDTKERSLLTVENADWEVAALRMKDGKILARLFNPSARAGVKRLSYGARAASIETVRLNGQILARLPTRVDSQGRTRFELALPSKGIGTLRIIPGAGNSTSPR